MLDEISSEYAEIINHAIINDFKPENILNDETELIDSPTNGTESA